MKRFILPVILFALAFGQSAISETNEVEAVKAVYVSHVNNANEGHVEAFIQQHMPGHTAFGPTGAMLSRWDSPDDEKRARPDLAKPIVPPNRLNHVEAQVYGGNTAVVTAYMNSTVTLSDGTTRPGIRRITSVWFKQNGQWREVHDHMSALIPPSTR